MNTIIDMRSDTITKPTEKMREAMKNAVVGDDVFGDDPTVNELEKHAAELMGMEAALFVTSGTQGNLISLMAQSQPGQEVLLEDNSHIYFYEVGNFAALGGLLPRPFASDRGYLSREGLEKLIRPDNIHHAETQILAIENTHNRHGGRALSPKQVDEMAKFGQDYGFKVHMDGARIFNAAVHHKVDVKEYTSRLDSIQFCLSKGLSAPVGSIIAGSSDFIIRARKIRKMLGGGMRQAGVIAAPGLIALKEMRNRLVEDHNNAKKLEQGLTKLGLEVRDTDTNIVVCDLDRMTSEQVISKFEESGILIVPFGPKTIRFTTNRHITSEDIDKVLEKAEMIWG